MGLAGQSPSRAATLRARDFADLCYLVEAPTGSSFERTEFSSWTFAPRCGPTTARLISMRSFGLRHGPPDVIEALARGEAVDPAAYYFRTTPRFETAHPAYAFLNHLITVASGDRRAEGPIYTIHELL